MTTTIRRVLRPMEQVPQAVLNLDAREREDHWTQLALMMATPTWISRIFLRRFAAMAHLLPPVSSYHLVMPLREEG